MDRRLSFLMVEFSNNLHWSWQRKYWANVSADAEGKPCWRCAVCESCLQGAWPLQLQPCKSTSYSECWAGSSSSPVSPVLALQAKRAQLFFLPHFLNWATQTQCEQPVMKGQGSPECCWARLTTTLHWELFTPHNVQLKRPWKRQSNSLQKYYFTQFSQLHLLFPTSTYYVQAMQCGHK